MAQNTRSGGRPFRPGSTQPEQPKPSPNSGPCPNTPDTWTSRPLGGQDDGKATKPAKHSTGDNTTTRNPNMRRTGEQRQNTPNPKQAVLDATHSNPTQPAGPKRATVLHTAQT